MLQYGPGSTAMYACICAFYGLQMEDDALRLLVQPNRYQSAVPIDGSGAKLPPKIDSGNGAITTGEMQLLSTTHAKYHGMLSAATCAY